MPSNRFTKLSLGLLLIGALSAWYWHIIQDGVRVPYYRSWGAKEIRYFTVNFGSNLFPCLIGRIVVEPEFPGGRIFGKTYVFENGVLDPKVINYGDIDRNSLIPGIEE